MYIVSRNEYVFIRLTSDWKPENTYKKILRLTEERQRKCMVSNSSNVSHIYMIIENDVFDLYPTLADIYLCIKYTDLSWVIVI